MKVNEERNNAIEFWRFIMIGFVCLLHFNEDYIKNHGTFAGGYLGVDFFFILSGYLLIKSYNKKNSGEKPGKQAVKYLLHRIKTLYPHYIFTFCTIVIYKAIIYMWGIKDVINYIWKCRWELFMLHNIGLPKVTKSVRSVWYISVLIVVSYFVYYLVAKNKEQFQYFICPISVLLIYVYIANTYGSLSMQGKYSYFINGGLLRGFAGMCLGSICYQITNTIKKYNLTNISKILLNFIEIISIVIIFFVMKKGFDLNDFTILIAFTALISITSANITFITRIINNKFSNFLGRLSYPIYLNHLLVFSIVIKLFHGNNNYMLILLISFISTFIYSIITNIIVNKIVRITSKIKFITA